MKQNDEHWEKIWRTANLVKALGALLLLSLILLSGCADGGARGIDACGPWRPIYVAESDSLTDGTARQILAHNEIGEQLCNWQSGN